MTQTIPEPIISASKAAQAKWGIPASISIAQWALESGWGAHLPVASNNPFGIKARIRNGVPIDPYVNANTTEIFTPGEVWHGPQPFRKFTSLAEAFDYHAQLLATAGAYANARKALPNVNAFADALTGVYATDPNYGTLLKSIIRTNNLTRFDA